LCLLALAASSTGCLNAPPHVVETSAGRVFGPIREETAALAERAAELYDAVGELLPASRDPRPDVWLQKVHHLPWYALSTGDLTGTYMRLQNRVFVSQEEDNALNVLAHEYVHARLGVALRRLPPALEEGLATAISFELEPSQAPYGRGWRLWSALQAMRSLQLELHYDIPDFEGNVAARFEYGAGGLDPLAVLERGKTRFWLRAPDDKRALYGLGFAFAQRLIDRIGISGLHELCTEIEDPRVLEAALLARARLTPDHASWVRMVLEPFRSEDLRALMADRPDEFALLAALIARSRFPKLDSRTFMDEARPRLALPYTSGSVPLVELGDVERSFHKLWFTANPKTVLLPGATVTGID